MAKHYINEVGTDFLFDTGIDLSSATAYVKWQKPKSNETAGVEGSWAATVYNSYSDLASAIGTYFVKYTITTSDLTTAGDWKFQAFVALAAGTWFGETVKETIFGEFE